MVEILFIRQFVANGVICRLPGSLFIRSNALQNWFDKIKIKTAELIWLSFCSFGIIFSLVPLWPWLALTWLVLWIRIKKKNLGGRINLNNINRIIFYSNGLFAG